MPVFNKHTVMCFYHNIFWVANVSNKDITRLNTEINEWIKVLQFTSVVEGTRSKRVINCRWAPVDDPTVIFLQETEITLNRRTIRVRNDLCLPTIWWHNFTLNQYLPVNNSTLLVSLNSHLILTINVMSRYLRITCLYKSMRLCSSINTWDH